MLSGCWTEAPRGVRATAVPGDQEPADQQEEVDPPRGVHPSLRPGPDAGPGDLRRRYAAGGGLPASTRGSSAWTCQLEPQPWLCQSYTYDAASLTYTFTLRSRRHLLRRVPPDGGGRGGHPAAGQDVPSGTAPGWPMWPLSPPGTGWCIVTPVRARTPASRPCWTSPSSSPEPRTSLTPVGTGPYYFSTG